MKTARYFAGAALLALPFIFSADGGEQLREPKARMLAIMFGLWIATELWKKVHPSLGCAAGFLFLSAFFTAPTFPHHAMLAMLGAFGSCLWIARPTKHDIERGLEILEISGILCATYACVFQLQGQWFFLTPLPGALPFAAFGQQTLYGPFAVACFASALFQGRHFRALLLFLPIPIVSSSFTYLSLGVVLFFYALSIFGKKAILGVLLVGLLLLTGSKIWPSHAREVLDDKNRFTLWGQALTLSSRHWVVGHGFASFRVIYPIFQDPELRKANGIDDSKQSPEFREFVKVAGGLKGGSGIFLHPHSEPISVFFEHGALGLLIALWWALAFVISAFRDQIEDFFRSWWGYEQKSQPIDPSRWALVAIFFAFLANSLGNFPFHLIPQALLPLWAFVAVTTQREEGILEEDA